MKLIYTFIGVGFSLKKQIRKQRNDFNRNIFVVQQLTGTEYFKYDFLKTLISGNF